MITLVLYFYKDYFLHLKFEMLTILNILITFTNSIKNAIKNLSLDWRGKYVWLLFIIQSDKGIIHKYKNILS